MSSSPSIPTSPPPGKDPPSPSPPLIDGPASPTTPPQPPSVTPQINSPIPPTPSASRIEPSFTTQRPLRPSPLRNDTSESAQRQSESNITTGASPRTFSPFFTLVHDPTTNSTHHPSRIHYIFSDDDQSDVLSAACIRAFDAAAEKPSASQLSTQDQKLQSSSTSSSSSATFRKDLKPQIKGKEAQRREERVIIIDMNEAGDGVAKASSLSEQWQILNAEVGSAPTYDVGEQEAGSEGNGLMLRIEGVGIEAADETVGLGLGRMGDSKERRKSGEAEDEDREMQMLLEGFDQKMALLRKVVASGIPVGGETEGIEGEKEEGTEV